MSTAQGAAQGPAPLEVVSLKPASRTPSGSSGQSPGASSDKGGAPASSGNAWWHKLQHGRDSPVTQDPSCNPAVAPEESGVDSSSLPGLKAGIFLGARSGTPAKKNSPRLDANAVSPDAEACGEPRIWVPSSRKSFASVAQAVASASEGDEILMKAGLYNETGAILFDKPNIALKAEEGGQVIIVFSSMEKVAPVVCRAKGVKLTGILLHRTGTLEKSDTSEAVNHTSGSCAVVEAGDVTFDTCTFKCQTGPGVFVCGDSRPTLTNCILTENHTAAIVCGGRSYTTLSGSSIKRNSGFGLWLLDHCDGMFTNCKIGGNSKCGVLCCGKSKGTFDHNKVSNGGQGGFWMQGETRTVVTNNMILRNHRAAMQVGDNADPIVAHNAILEGEGGGIVVHDRARGLFFRNELSGSCRAGAGVMDLASPLFMGNTMSKNNGGGAVVAGSSTPSFIANDFLNNGFVGVGMKETSRVLMQGNTVTGTVGYGVLMQGSSQLHLQDTRLEQNEQSGVCACDDTQLKSYGCTISAGSDKAVQQCGITLHGNASMYVEGAQISGHVAGNVLFNDKSTGTIMQSHISGSRSSGVTMQGNASVRLFRNVITGNRVSNVLVLDESSLVAEWNSIMEAAGCGIRTMGGSKCVINHNTIMSNHETGVVCSGKMQLEMKLNRVSQNGKDGVYVDNVERAAVIDNAIFDNSSSGLRLKNVINLTVTGNLLLSSLHKQTSNSAALVFRGSIGGHIADNLLHAKTGSIVAGEALKPLLEANVPCTSQKHAAEAVTLALASLHYLEQKRDAVTLVQMPDGSTSVAQRCSDMQKRKQEAALIHGGQTNQANQEPANVNVPVETGAGQQSATKPTAVQPQGGSPTPLEVPSQPAQAHAVQSTTNSMEPLLSSPLTGVRPERSRSSGVQRVPSGGTSYDIPRTVLEDAMRRGLAASSQSPTSVRSPGSVQSL